jgi:hypothetical protein
MEYAELMWQWAHGGTRLPKPRADFQRGTHIDTLPIEDNRRGTTGVVMPAYYLTHGKTYSVPELLEIIDDQQV